MNPFKKPTRAPLNIWQKKEIEVTETRTIRRITFKNFASEIFEAFNLNKGFLKTFVELFYRPATVIKGYLDEDRYKYTNPAKYFLIIVGVTLFIANEVGFFENQKFNWEEALVIEADELKSQADDDETFDVKAEDLNLPEVFENIYTNYFVKYQNALSLVNIIFISFFSFLMFRKVGYNLLEHFVINTYIFVHIYLLFLLEVIFNFSLSIWAPVYIATTIIYSTWCYYYLFKSSLFSVILKTFVLQVISTIIYMILLVAIVVIGAIAATKT
jgi:hypothetical protein